MNFDQLVRKRHSIRSYDGRPVSRELIDQCLDAARLAPSACNSQPWSFIVVDDRNTIDRIVDTACSGMYRLNRFVKTAPVLIVIITENSKYIARLGGKIRDVRYNLIDIGIAGDHLTLQAEELGLGTCWLGWFKEDGVRDVLGLPETTQIDILISLGYPDGTPLPKKKRKSLEKIRRYADPVSDQD